MSQLLLAGAESCVAELLWAEEREMDQSSWEFNTLIPTKCFKRSSTIAGVETENRELKESRRWAV
jgi:hypothetical protein